MGCGRAIVAASLMAQALISPGHAGASVQPSGQPAGTAPSAAASRPFLALYRRGPSYDGARPLFEQASIRAHIAHHEALGSRLIGAGPLRGAPEGIVGAILIFARDAAEAETWLQADPAVRAGTLSAAIAEWSTTEIRAYRRARE